MSGRHCRFGEARRFLGSLSGFGVVESADRVNVDPIWLWVKNRYLEWKSGKWKHGLKPAVL